MYVPNTISEDCNLPFASSKCSPKNVPIGKMTLKLLLQVSLRFSVHHAIPVFYPGYGMQSSINAICPL